MTITTAKITKITERFHNKPKLFVLCLFVQCCVAVSLRGSLLFNSDHLVVTGNDCVKVSTTYLSSQSSDQSIRNRMTFSRYRKRTLAHCSVHEITK